MWLVISYISQLQSIICVYLCAKPHIVCFLWQTLVQNRGNLHFCLPLVRNLEYLHLCFQRRDAEKDAEKQGISLLLDFHWIQNSRRSSHGKCHEAISRWRHQWKHIERCWIEVCIWILLRVEQHEAWRINKKAWESGGDGRSKHKSWEIRRKHVKGKISAAGRAGVKMWHAAALMTCCREDGRKTSGVYVPLWCDQPVYAG